ncbi:MAG TPA: PAC2 family protein, partial [Acidimicrobiales bacterium]
MADNRLVHIVDEVPELDARPGAEQLTEGLTMVVVLDGFLDAGNAAGRAAQHLLDLADSRVVATFDVDQLHDYRARR